MRRRLAIPYLLVALILAGQWLVALHDGSHKSLPNGADSCVVCVYAHGLGHGATLSLPALALRAAPLEVSVAPVVALPARPRNQQPIRGPPVVL